jgi:hypothetical protein
MKRSMNARVLVSSAMAGKASGECSSPAHRTRGRLHIRGSRGLERRQRQKVSEEKGPCQGPGPGEPIVDLQFECWGDELMD